ncbi:arsenate reductase (glutaredoxin) [Vibrio sp. SS-MA-C1-2]|uniref:arsenate reductase (glutaredoxin) n=1 Tax=Vibrio sp. SS-MA-C1-2 TaxID=2908646 RepID=UPI001EEAAABB|nr:arsenate reductase (glutaredoxin) [Vibrio sp. SS-MA-C1-2]UJF20114.1 arsenate reductase (glutaredoxin) [Vibrio sp. SS-MA-C1-2]
MPVTIYHNPRCSKSRQTLALLEEKNIQPTVVLYLDINPTADEIKNLIQQLGFDSARQLMRTKDELYKSLNLKTVEDEGQLIEAMANNAKLIERPIVVTEKGARIGRPPEQVLEVI